VEVAGEEGMEWRRGGDGVEEMKCEERRRKCVVGVLLPLPCH
jgi:hypothetical protein